MSVGWGRSTWGAGPWGQPHSVPISFTISGVAGTSALGSVSVDAESNVTLSDGEANVSVTLGAATASIGSVTVHHNARFDINGVSATGSLGSPTVVAKANILVIGVSATGEVGNPFVWSLIDETQTPDYNTIDQTQTPGWEDVA